MARAVAYARHHAVAFLALFVALGGSSYAAVKLPSGSVTSRTVKDRSLLAKDFKRGQLPRGATGTTGAAGRSGAPGLPGPAGAVGPAGAPGGAGPAGTKGEPGAKGDTGPSMGRSSAADIYNTPTAGGVTQATVTIDAPTAGRLLVLGGADITATCTGPGYCAFQAGLFVDGVPVPASATQNQLFSATLDLGVVSLTGVTGVLPAGSHTLTLQTKAVNPATVVANTPTAKAVLLGSG